MTVKKTNTRDSKQKIPVTNNSAKQAAANRWVLPCILALVFVVYMPALPGGFVRLDDDYYIVKNPFLRNFSLNGMVAIFTSFYSYNYHPLTSLSWLLEYTFFGANPFSYHFINVLLHVANTWLVYKVIVRLSGSEVTAYVAAAMFGLHPMHVESVAWVSERKDVLYTFFYLLALWNYIKFAHDGSRKLYVYTLLFFVLSLMSKSAAVTLPLLLLVVDWYKGRRVTARGMGEKMPFFVLSVLFGVINIAAQKQGGALDGSAVTEPLLHRLLVIITALTYYPLQFVFPTGMCAMHYYPEADTALPGYLYFSVPILAAILWLATKRSWLTKNFRFGVAFYLVTIAVMLPFVQIGATYVAERYSYVSYIGFAFVAGCVVAHFMEGKYRKATIALAVAVVLVCAGMSLTRVKVWHDDATLFRDIARNYPEQYLAYYKQANVKKDLVHNREALQLYDAALMLQPDFEKAYVGCGAIYEQMGDEQKALASYEAAVRLDPRDYEAWTGCGANNDGMGNRGAAMEAYNKAIAINKMYAPAYTGRGWALYSSGDTAGGLRDYATALTLDSNNVLAYNNLGWYYYNRSQLDSALWYYNKALLKQPDNSRALSNRAMAWYARGNMKAAIEDYTRMIANDNDDYNALQNRGLVRLAGGDTTGAIADLQAAAALGSAGASEVLRTMGR